MRHFSCNYIEWLTAYADQRQHIHCAAYVILLLAYDEDWLPIVFMHDIQLQTENAQKLGFDGFNWPGTE